MLAFREAHSQGATRVSIGGQHILTGGADGVVSLFPSKQWPKSAALWSFNCHEGAVTDVVLADTLDLALSCGRDGRILLHENISEKAKLVSRVICQVTGEVRCLQLDAERRRVYIAGDSLRCLEMAQDRFNIHTIPLVVAFPIVTLAVSPCGRYLAMGGAAGDLGVVPTPPPSMAAASMGAVAADKAQFIFRSVLSPTAKRDDAVRYRMAWCAAEAGGLLLMVPTATEVRVYQLDDAAAPSRMRSIGGLHDRQLMDLHGALVYRVTTRRLACVMAARDGIFIGKVEAKSLAMSRHTSEHYRNATNEVAAVTDVQVNAANGDVVVGLSDGRVSLLRKASLRELKPTAGKVTAKDITATPVDGEVGGEATDEAAAKAQETHSHAELRKTRSKMEEEDDDFINDDDDDSASESSAESTSSFSDGSSDSGVAPEDFGKVVVDLQRNGASVHDNDEERPSRWRDEDAEAALEHAEREAERQRARSRFLDDEAEEGSAVDEDEDVDEEDRYDGASVEGLVEEREDGEGDDFGGRNAASHSTSSANAHLLAARAPAAQDYSFQVGATPAGEEGSCYLAYNSVGYIHCSRDATTVHFHDISYPAVRVQLRDTIVMGSLSPVGAGFVVVPTEPSDAQGSVDEAPRLTVFYHAFTPLGAQSEWRVPLLAGETVRCMAAGIRYLAVATSHYLRIFSLSGLELAVLSKCQRIVTMVGTSSRKLMSSFKADFDPLAIVALSGTGELQMEVIDVGSRAAALPARTIPLTELPDGTTHQLQWLGWSEDGLLHTADTAGVVRMFTEDWGGTWVPVYDPRTLVDQSYALWVYGVSDNTLLAYRYSRDDPSYPAAAASGLSTELVPLFLPLTRTMGGEGLDRWDKVLRQQIRSDELKRHSAFYNATIAKYDDIHDHHLLQFFESALKGQQTTRALELAMLMETHDRIIKCVQLANSSGYTKLVPKLLALYEMRMASKSKRRCTLPLKETMLSDKKKDELLRKLLGQVLPQETKRKSAEPPAAEPCSGASVATAVSVEDTEEAKRKAPLPQRQTPADSVKRGEVSPPRAPSSTSTAATGAAGTPLSTASTATTVDAETPLKSAARRHISFASEAVPHTSAPAPPPPTLSQTSTATAVSSVASSAVAGPHKVQNPFAKPAAAAAPAVKGGPESASVPAPTHPTRLNTPLSTSPSPSSRAPRQTTLLGASQCSTPPRTMVLSSAPSASSSAAVTTFHASNLPLSSPSLAVVDAKVEEQQQRQHEGVDAATSVSSPGGSPEDRRVSAGHATDSPAPPRSDQASKPPKAATSGPTKPTVSFIPRQLPTYADTSSIMSSGPVDPFLEVESPFPKATTTPAATMAVSGYLPGRASISHNSVDSYNSAANPEVPTVSVQSLLDVGHEETAPVVRSDSFGEALRKRYRDDDETEDELDGAPLAAVPRLML